MGRPCPRTRTRSSRIRSSPGGRTRSPCTPSSRSRCHRTSTGSSHVRAAARMRGALPLRRPHRAEGGCVGSLHEPLLQMRMRPATRARSRARRREVPPLRQIYGGAAPTFVLGQPFRHLSLVQNSTRQRSGDGQNRLDTPTSPQCTTLASSGGTSLCPRFPLRMPKGRSACVVASSVRRVLVLAVGWALAADRTAAASLSPFAPPEPRHLVPDGSFD